MTTINAHQLGRLIEKVRSHVGPERIETIHGIRLDVDANHLHTIATDRFTIAAARYRLNHDDKNQEPWGRTIPAAWLKPLREWIAAHAGAEQVTISTAADRVDLTTARTEFRIPVVDDQEFPNWRALLRHITLHVPEKFIFPAVDSRLLARWADTDDVLRVHVTSDLTALMVFGEDFIGAQIPKRYAGIGPCENETFEAALALWPTLDEEADGTAELPTEEKSRYNAANTIPSMVEALLQQTLRSTSDLLGAPSEDPGAMASFALAGVNSWSAYRFLNALHKADPRLAAQTVAELAEELDAGDFSETAWDIAEKAGHDPQKWSDDYAAHLKRVAEEGAAERMQVEADTFADRLASALNAAKTAGISFTVEDNAVVTFDDQRGKWVEAPKPAEPLAST
ncbi:hypothetical protein [Streptomyces griseus]|uniref:hypothetical protein n=1 Tax=Streptomyces griseus TaxID=1911 RepID=UPI0037A4571B